MSTTERHNLPSGAWVQFRDPMTLRRGDKKRAMASVSGDVDKPLAMAYEMTDGILQVLIIDWSYDLPLPSASPDSLDLLPLADDQKLMELTEPVRKLLWPEESAKDAKDEASPTEPSAA
ncbi:hypothetical protein OIU81_02800 [Streptomyces sp. NBC_01454]|uniref:hypothetical protein n=1 Tax=Streptomyces sp. NBC_01454 TaxID=2975867 RepID=UPI002E35C4EE|nr:hypothetical protein [Streptomyces sp. NBC_01454]